jgi:formylmethanofuran dehydrogenase subunit C
MIQVGVVLTTVMKGDIMLLRRIGGVIRAGEVTMGGMVSRNRGNRPMDGEYVYIYELWTLRCIVALFP